MKPYTYIFLLLVTLNFSGYFLAGCSDYTKNLGSGYFFTDEGGDFKDILCEVPHGGEIPSTVLSYDYNEKFIIAKQKPSLPQDILYDKEYIYKNGAEEFYYWLIIKEIHLVFGPLELKEFNEIREKYEVPEDLILK